ncbi:MAG: PQQ-binding-like beta-propeller repeat protein [Planctomycetes bacterium]|nr:PQQ-binding-like beta-propeller repeat protein [Planctomycetota bacterium]
MAACGIPSQARPVDRDPLAPDPTSRQPVAYYEAQLAELPLRVRSYDLTGVQRNSPVVVRELHVVHDDVRDEILVVDADGDRSFLWSIDAYDFTLHWRTPLEKRVNFDPLSTRNYIILMNGDGEYQAYDRLNMPRKGESRLVSKGRYGDLFPSAAPACNDTHIFVPGTNTNSVQGLSMISNSRGESPESWKFPKTGGNSVVGFKQVSMRPTADRETVAFVNNNNHLYMVDAQNGEYRASPFLEANSRTNPLLKDDLVFVGSDKGMLYAWQKSGQSAFTITLDGIPYGDIFVEDRWIFVRTMEIYEKETRLENGETGSEVALRQGKLCAYRYKVIDIKDDRPVFEVLDGDPRTSHIKDPVWTLDDVGQQVLMLTDDYAYVLYEQNEKFLSERELAELKASGRIVTKHDELRTVSRQLRVLDLNTGKLARPEWNLNLMDFTFVRGSMHERDRALYLATSDGYVFKAFSKAKGSAGGK